jgi:hypothetical protein
LKIQIEKKGGRSHRDIYPRKPETEQTSRCSLPILEAETEIHCANLKTILEAREKEGHMSCEERFEHIGGIKVGY